MIRNDRHPGLLDALDPDLTGTLTTRREALARGGDWGRRLLLASVPLGLAVLARDAWGQSGLPQAVREILNFALTLEYLEAEYYTLGLATPGLVPPGDAPLFDQIRKHEDAHVALLRSVLGDAAAAKPTFDFTAGGAFAPFQDYGQFQALAQGFEDTGVRAYKGQAAGLQGTPDLLDAALQIHSVEARHASEVRALRGQSRWIVGAEVDIPALQPIYAGEDNTTHAEVNAVSASGVGIGAVTEAWDEPLSRDEVLAIAGLFIVP